MKSVFLRNDKVVGREETRSHVAPLVVQVIKQPGCILLKAYQTSSNKILEHNS